MFNPLQSSQATLERKPARVARLDRVITRNYFVLAVGIVVFAGFLTRAYQLGARSLWYDEAVIVDIGRGSIEDILSANARLNSAPPVYPLLVRITGDVWGTSEAQLRSVSLAAGVLALVSIAFLARQWLGWLGSVSAVGFMAFSTSQVYYSRELREYSFVSLFTIMIFLTMNWMLERRASYLRAGVYTLVALATLSFQLGLVIVVACAQAVYLWHTIRVRSKRSAALYVFSTTSVIVGLVSVYLLAVQYRVQTGALTFSYLASYYGTSTSITDVAQHLWSNTSGLLDFVFSANTRYAFALLVLVGIWSLGSNRRQGRRGLVYLLLPVVTVAVLSILRVYPYGGTRQDIFLLPMFYVAGAAGLDLLSRLVSRSELTSAFVSGLVLVVFSGFALRDNQPMYSETATGENLRPVVEHLAEQVSSHDAIYIYYSAAPAFRYYWYTRQLGSTHQDTSIVWGTNNRTEPSKYLSALPQCFDEANRCWTIFSHTFAGSVNEQEFIVAWFRARYVQQDRFAARGSPANAQYADTALYSFARQ